MIALRREGAGHLSAAGIDMDERRYDRIVGAIYEVPTAPEQWTAVLQSIAGMIGGGTIGLAGAMNASAELLLYASFGVDPEIERHFLNRYNTPANNCMYACFPTMPVGLPLELPSFGLEYATLQKTELYEELHRPQDLLYTAITLLARTEGLVAPIAFIKPRTAGGFDPEQLTLLERLVPHLRRSLHLQMRLMQMTARQCALELALDRLAFGVIAIGTSGRAAMVNKAAEAILAENDGLALRRNVLSPWRSNDAAMLRGYLANALRGRDGRPPVAAAMTISRPSGRKNLLVEVVPVGLASSLMAALGGETAIVLVVDPERRPASPDAALLRLFGLSPAETRLAAALAGGDRLEDIAGAFGVKMPTLRTQLASILHKTQTSRQSDLVKLLSSLPIVFGSDRLARSIS